MPSLSVHRELVALAHSSSPEPHYDRVSSEKIKSQLQNGRMDEFKKLFVRDKPKMTHSVVTSSNTQTETVTNLDQITDKVADVFKRIEFSRFQSTFATSSHHVILYGEGIDRTISPGGKINNVAVWVKLHFNKDLKIDTSSLDEIKFATQTEPPE